jgi:hypothetical protein
VNRPLRTPDVPLPAAPTAETGANSTRPRAATRQIGQAGAQVELINLTNFAWMDTKEHR